MISVLKGHFGNGWLQLFDMLWNHKNPGAAQQIATEAATLKNKLAYAFGQKLQLQKRELIPEAKELQTLLEANQRSLKSHMSEIDQVASRLMLHSEVDMPDLTQESPHRQSTRLLLDSV